MVERVFFANPYTREIEANIVEKTYEDGKYFLKLDKTIFYPHLSGGQPGDKGTINDLPLVEVYEEDDEIIHVLREDIKGDRVLLKIDWANRLDNMQQHSGQHLLSAAFSNIYGGETIGFHIGSESVTIDLTLADLKEEEVEKIESYVNKIIFSNFKIKSYFVDKDSIGRIPLRKPPSVDSDIRIVEIDGIDYSPCGGTHLRRTGELGLVKILKWKKYKGNIRLEFLCGNRALQDYRWKNQAIKEISLMLSSKDKDIVDKVQILLKQKISLEKDLRILKKTSNK